jgi:Single-stranded DNA-binding protein
MDEVTNRVELCGTVPEAPHFSHESRGIRFFVFPLETRRLSGAVDKINVIARESLMAGLEMSPAGKMCVEGELRSFNNKSGVGSRLVITVFARKLSLGDGEDENNVLLSGTVCKEPVLRVTPMGRQICDLILAVGRHYSRSDYIPVIAWGGQAQDAAMWSVGSRLQVSGRIQSRKYMKVMDGTSLEKTAFEVSAAEIVPL